MCSACKIGRIERRNIPLVSRAVPVDIVSDPINSTIDVGALILELFVWEQPFHGLPQAAKKRVGCKCFRRKVANRDEAWHVRPAFFRSHIMQRSDKGADLLLRYGLNHAVAHEKFAA